MKKLVSRAVCAMSFMLVAGHPTTVVADPVSITIPYGVNQAASGTFVHDGVTLYYEVYGAGPPLLLVHGNGNSIGFLAAQIEFFKNTRRVIVMDSRDHGRSGDSVVPLTYEKMTDDLAALLDHLQTGPVDIVGWSDGGVEALLMGLRHPGKVRMLVAMAANLDPGGLIPETTNWVKDALAAIPRDTAAGQRALKVTGMLLTEPQIDLAQIEAITAPTLILSGDHDMVRLQHTIAIYEALPNGQLAVLPNSTHAVPYDDPQMFNTTVERFLTTPFRNRDPVLDASSSLERMNAEQPK